MVISSLTTQVKLLWPSGNQLLMVAGGKTGGFQAAACGCHDQVDMLLFQPLAKSFSQICSLF